MFRLALAALACTLVPAVAMFGTAERHLALGWLQAALIPAAIVVPVLIQWALHSRAAKDTIHGGWLLVEETDWGVTWTSWGVVFTHAGHVDEQAGILYVRSSLLLGLLPYRFVRRPLSELYRVVVDSSYSEAIRSRYSYAIGSRSGVPIIPDRFWYAVRVVDRRAHEQTLIDFLETGSSERGTEMVARLRTRLEAALGIGGGNPIARTKSERHAPQQIAAPPPPFSAQAAAPAGGPAMVCPNCSRRYAMTETRCAACRVVLYRD